MKIYNNEDNYNHKDDIAVKSRNKNYQLLFVCFFHLLTAENVIVKQYTIDSA